MRNFTGKSLTDSGLKRYTRRLTANYFLALAMVGTLAVALFVVLLAQINSQGRYATMIELSGRQRSLVQRVALFALRLTQEPDPPRRREFRAIIRRSVVDLERIQIGLIQGDAALELPGHPDEEIESLYLQPPTDLNRRVAAFAATVHALLAQGNDAPLDPRSPQLATVLDAVPGELLAALETATAAYEQSNRRNTHRLQAFEAVLVLGLLLTLFAELRFIFRPLVRAILRETGVLAASRRRHDAVLRTVGEAIVTLDAGNIIRSANAEAERVWGVAVAEFVGQSVNALVLPGRDLAPTGWRAMFPQDRRAQTVGVRRGGETFPLELRLTETILRGVEADPADATPAGGRFYTLCARDISERVEAEHLVAAARDAALESARARSEFVGERQP